MILEKSNLETVQDWIDHRIDSLICTPKNSNHLRSHLRAIVALDHSRLGLENKFLENKSGRILLRSTSFLYRILLTNLGASKPTFYTFIDHIWGETILWGAVFIMQTSHRTQYFTILKYKLHSFNIKAFSETAKKISKITYTTSRLRAVECLNEH